MAAAAKSPSRRLAVILFVIAATLTVAAPAAFYWLDTHPLPQPPSSVTVPVTIGRPKGAKPQPSSEASGLILPAPVVSPGKAVAINSAGAVPNVPVYSAFSSQHGLLPAPAADLIERGPYGFLPIVGHDGRNPWQVYARPFDLTSTAPRVAIVITGLAIASKATNDAITKTPLDVTLAFAPFGRHVADWVNLARATGHEVLMELPMEPIDYPHQDPGYNALLTAYEPPQNLDRLSWVMSQSAGYVGLIGRMGGKFQASRGDMTPILDEIAQRGLLFLDNREAAQTVVPDVAATDKLPIFSADRVIDADPSRLAIDQALIDLATTAKRNGAALGLASAAPVTLQEINAWAATLATQGLVLAPVSAIVAVPPPPAPPPDKAPASSP